MSDMPEETGRGRPASATHLILAVDGLAASGKGTLCHRLAETLDLALLDTGLLYRAVGMKMVEADQDPNDHDLAIAAAKSLDFQELADESRLRNETAGRAASRVAVIPGVRAALLDFQQNFALLPPKGKKGTILDGRDIGTVICPWADVKLFVTADVEIRAERRYKELQSKGNSSIQAQVLQDLKERDARDQKRSTAPTVAAPDAYNLDTSHMTRDQVFEKAMNVILAKRPDLRV